jgi:alkylation response protein AidB-like acyl-CoA dehydrogenase
MIDQVGVADTEDQQALAEAVRGVLGRFWSAEDRGKRVSDPDAVLERPLWEKLAELGVAGLPMPEASGGSGGRWSDLAVAWEVLGGALAAVPAPAAAGALAALAGTDPARAGAVADGSLLPAVAWTGREDEVLVAANDRVSGRVEVVLTPEAEVVLLPVAVDDGTVLGLVHTAADGVSLTRTPGLDPTRPLGSLTLSDAPLTVLARGEDAYQALARGRAASAGALAGESVGAGGHCLASAVAYAQERHQFGQPIGAFQAVKHRLADALAAVELARAAARHLAELLDDPAAGPDELSDAASLALLRAGSMLLEVSNSYIQTLGGIGFTWEHEAHLYFRRAGLVEVLFGGPSEARHRLDPTSAPCAGATDVVGSPSGPAADLESHLLELLPAFREQWGDDDSFTARLAWQRVLHAEGWIAPQWPVEYGGRGLDIVDQVACDAVLAARRAPALAGVLGVNNVAPTLMRFGTEAQKRHIAAIQSGEEVFCQGFSEPGSGSDLASLRTRAVATGDGEDPDFVISGQKVWTSEGMEATHCLLLARTDPDAPAHRGISAFVVPMDSPGITRRPIMQMTGEGGFAELFFDDVRVPASALLGPLHQGWKVTMTTLAFERAGVIMMAARMEREVADAVAGVADRSLADDTRIALTDRLVEARLLGLLGRRALGRIAEGGQPGPEHSVIKMVWSQAAQKLPETALFAYGAAALTAPEAASARREFLFSRATTIAGGTSEVMRNILAERVLGLPKGG